MQDDFQSEKTIIPYTNLLCNEYQQELRLKLKKLVYICQVHSYNYTPHYYEESLQLQSFQFLKYNDNSVLQNIIYQEIFNSI